MRFVIRDMFYEIINVQCVYSSSITMFIGRIQRIFYVRYNYMFRRLIMAIFRLYMKKFIGANFRNEHRCKIDTSRKVNTEEGNTILRNVGSHYHLIMSSIK